MVMKFILNPDYRRLEPFLRRLADPGWFRCNGETLHADRNTVKRFEAGGVRLAVKSYEDISAFNRLVYGRLRRSKAERAYRYARRLRSLGIDTPEEVAVVDIRRGGLLRESYFVSLYADWLPLQPVTDSFVSSPDAEPVLDALSQCLFKLHWAGVVHNDLNQSNILYKYDAEMQRCRFMLIDTNRMEFHRMLSMRQRLDNLRRLSCNVSAYLYILQRYAELMHANPSSLQLRGAVRRLLFELRREAHGRLKLQS